MTFVQTADRTGIGRLEKAAVFEVVFNDDVRDGVENKLDVVGVSGAGEMRVDLLDIGVTVQSLEPTLYIYRCLLICIGTCISNRLSIRIL